MGEEFQKQFPYENDKHFCKLFNALFGQIENSNNNLKHTCCQNISNRQNHQINGRDKNVMQVHCSSSCFITYPEVPLAAGTLSWQRRWTLIRHAVAIEYRQIGIQSQHVLFNVTTISIIITDILWDFPTLSYWKLKYTSIIGYRYHRF